MRRRIFRSGNPLDEGPRRALRRANRLMEIGDFINASTLYENLARAARDRTRPRFAAMYFLQAAQGRLLAGQADAGLALAQEGLGILAEMGMWVRFRRHGRQAVAGFERQGQTKQAEQLSQWIEQRAGGHPEASSQEPAGTPGQPRPRLPLKCPFCGATVNPDEVEWVDEGRAECAYCGSVIE